MVKESTDPDIIYAIQFVQIHVNATTMLLLLFIPKVNSVLIGYGGG